MLLALKNCLGRFFMKIGFPSDPNQDPQVKRNPNQDQDQDLNRVPELDPSQDQDQDRDRDP